MELPGNIVRKYRSRGGKNDETLSKGYGRRRGLLWGGAILIVGLINLADPSYGMSFIQMTSSVYPWFHASHSAANVVMGTIDGLIDGAIAGVIFALLYNAVSQVPVHTQEPHQQAHA